MPEQVPKQRRQFAAIMFTDIVGYTALMGSDEDRAFEVLGKNKKIHEDLIKKFKGSLIKEMGDGMLISFDLASDAVHCAMEIQKECKEQKIPLKIGIHEGETVFSGSDVHGDGVNVASRLEAASEVGRISISGKVYSDVKNIKDINTSYLGQKRFKNVDEAIRVYHVLSEGENQKLKSASKISKEKNFIYPLTALVVIVAALWILKLGPFAPPEFERSIAVMPFDNESNDQKNAFFVNGMMQDIRDNLSKIADLQVISKASTEKYREMDFLIKDIADTLKVNYLLTGTVQKQGDQVTIQAELIYSETGNPVWSDIYYTKVSDGEVFEVQSQIAQSIAETLKAVVTPEERQLIDTRPTNNTLAYEFYLRGREYSKGSGETNVNVARHFYRRAITLDPGFALAYTWLGFSYFHQSRLYEISEDNFGDSIKFYAEKALSIDPDIADAHWLLAQYYWEINNNRIQSTVEATIAVELNPNNGLAYGLLGLNSSYEYDFPTAIIYLEKAKDLLVGDFDQYPEILDQIATVYMAICDYDRSMEASMEILGYNPTIGYNNLAAISLMKGELEKAKLFTEKLCEIGHSWNCNHLQQLYYSITEDFERFKIPEGSVGYVELVDPNWKGFIYHNIGKEEEAQEFIQNSISDWEGIIRNNRGKIPQAGYELAAYYAFLDDSENAYRILHEMEETIFYGGFVWFIQVDPRFKDLWEEDEFRQIVARQQKKYLDIRDELDVLRAEGKL